MNALFTADGRPVLCDLGFINPLDDPIPEWAMDTALERARIKVELARVVAKGLRIEEGYVAYRLVNDAVVARTAAWECATKAAKR